MSELNDKLTMTRGEADDLLFAAYQDGTLTADEYIGYLRAELHEAWAASCASDGRED